MKALKILGVIVGVIVVTVLILMFTLSGKQHVEPSVVINADPEKVFNELVTLKNLMHGHHGLSVIRLQNTLMKAPGKVLGPK